VQEQYTWDAVSDRWTRLYRRLAAAPRELATSDELPAPADAAAMQEASAR
jgi:hypothetical protein